MKPVTMFFAFATMLSQDIAAIAKQGESTFAKTCGSGYCRGSGGAGGGARHAWPRVILIRTTYRTRSPMESRIRRWRLMAEPFPPLN